MAYSFGGGVRPELGKTDYSGYLQGALTGAQGVAAGGAAIGQGIEKLGAGIGEGIKKYQENKVIVGQLTAKNEDALKDEKFKATLPAGAQALIKKAETNGNLGFKDASVLAAYVDAGKISQKETFNKTLSTQTAQAFGMMQKTGSTNLPLIYQNILPEARVAASNLFVNDQLKRAQTNQASGSAYASRNPTPKTPTPFNTLYQNGVRAWVEENPDTKITGTVLKKIATDAQKAAASGNSVTVQAPQPIPDKGWKYNYNEQGQVVSQSMIPGGPAELEALGKKQSSENLSIALGDMAGALVGLANLNATVSPTQTGAENISSKVRGSAAGQFVGAAMGTQEQSFRQQYSNIKPVVLNAVRNATNMSAKAMDSDVELKLYLSQLGHENNDIISNVAALHAINQQYGGLSDVIKQVMAGLTDPEMRKAVYARLGEMLDKGAEASRNAKPQPKRAAKLISVRPSGK
jgi:hypothetical protein